MRRITPSGMPMMIEMMIAVVASSSVAGKKRAMSLVTGCVVITEVPMSPCTRLFR